MSIAEVIVRYKKSIRQVVLVTVNLVVNYNTILNVSVCLRTDQEAKILNLVALFI